MMRGMLATSSRPMSLGRRAIHTFAIATSVFLCMGSSCLDDVLGTNTGTDGGTPVTVLSGPQLEVTVDGVHVGPEVLSAGSYADFVDTAASFGNSSSTLSIHAVTTDASFVFAVDVFGDSIQPIHAASYALETSTGSATDNGSASLDGAPQVTAGQLTLECDDGTCGGGVLTITVMDTAHVEGYLSATMANPSDGQESMVVVTFYVPWQTYSP
jgi:hypothetical protein